MKIAGPRTWRKWEKDAENLPCESCAKRGIMHIRGIHDVENVKEGKAVHDPENFKKFVGEVNLAAEKAGLNQTGIAPVIEQSGSGMDTDLLLLGGIAVFATIMAFITPRTPV